MNPGPRPSRASPPSPPSSSCCSTAPIAKVPRTSSRAVCSWAPTRETRRVVAELADAGGDVNTPLSDPDRQFPLHAAAVASRLTDSRGVIEELVARGATVDVRNTLGTSPLVAATLMGRVDVVQCLLRAGCPLEKALRRCSSRSQAATPTRQRPSCAPGPRSPPRTRTAHPRPRWPSGAPASGRVWSWSGDSRTRRKGGRGASLPPRCQSRGPLRGQGKFLHS